MFDFCFFYGSLKTGFPNNNLLQGNGYFVCPAKTRTEYRMYACGNFPAMVKEPNGISVEGELWIIEKSFFPELDTFEGVKVNLYRRELMLLAEPCVLAYSYIFCRSVNNLPDCGSIWK